VGSETRLAVIFEAYTGILVIVIVTPLVQAPVEVAVKVVALLLAVTFNPPIN
jgi:hypothetical protein